MYIVPYKLIFFPTHIVSNICFLPRNFRTLFLTRYSSQQPQYYREDNIASPLPFLHVIFFPTVMNSLPLFAAWYSPPTDMINTPALKQTKNQMPWAGAQYKVSPLNWQLTYRNSCVVNKCFTNDMDNYIISETNVLCCHPKMWGVYTVYYLNNW